MIWGYLRRSPSFFLLFLSVSNVYCILCFSMIFDPITIAFNGFWSNDGMASMDRRDLDCLHLKEQTRRAQDCVGWGEPLHILPSWTSDLDLPSAGLLQEPHFFNIFIFLKISYILLQSVGGCTSSPRLCRHFCLPFQRSLCLYYGDICFRSTNIEALKSYRVFFLTGTPLKVLSVILHSVRIYLPKKKLVIFRGVPVKKTPCKMNIARLANAVNVTLYCNVTMIAIISGSQLSTISIFSQGFTSHVYLCIVTQYNTQYTIIVSFCLSLFLGLLFGHAFSVGQVSSSL